MVPVSTLSKDRCPLITKILNEFQDIFTIPGRDLGRTNAVQHEIHVDPQVSPIRLPKWHLPLKQQDIVSNEVQKIKDKGFTQESQSPWSAPVVIVKKKDSSYRFCVDYRKLNDVTSKKCFSLPNIEDTFLSSTRYF